MLDAGVEDWVRRIHEFGREADTADARKLRVRLEDKGAIVAFHWRGAPDEDAARAAIDAIAERAQAAGLRTHWGARCSRSARRSRSTRAPGSRSFLAEAGAGIDSALYVGDDTTDLDAFRALADAGRRRGSWRGRCASGSDPTRGRRRSPARPTSSSTGPRACASCSRLLSAE